MMKKVLALLLALTLSLSLVACGAKDSGGGDNTTTPPTDRKSVV